MSQLIEEDESVGNIVSFAFADRNCKLKFKTVDNKFHGFSNKNEFMALVVKISEEQQMTDAFREDEENNELFY